jgi:hypothetical protein
VVPGSIPRLCHICEFVGSLPCFEGFSLVFLPLQKATLNSDLISEWMWMLEPITVKSLYGLKVICGYVMLFIIYGHLVTALTFLKVKTSVEHNWP